MLCEMSASGRTILKLSKSAQTRSEQDGQLQELCGAACEHGKASSLRIPLFVCLLFFFQFCLDFCQHFCFFFIQRIILQ